MVCREYILGLLCALLLPSVSLASGVAAVRFEPASFNPSSGEKVELHYEVSRDVRVTARILDPDGGLVKVLAENEPKTAGSHTETWDGRDIDDHVVPNEAYSVTLETSDGETFDPRVSFEGRVGDVTNARFDSEAGTVVYELPAPARVLIRAGIANGPMMKTLVDWKPRVAGSITEYWDGRDESETVNVRDQKDFTALITYSTLPDATVIAFGNEREGYRDFKLGRGSERPVYKPEPRVGQDSIGSVAGLVPPAWSRAPRVVMSVAEQGGTATESLDVGDVVNVKVDVDASDRADLLSDQFEIIFYVDNVFFSEAERGHLPMTWRWETAQLAAGEHVLTVNVSSFKGQVGVATRKVRIPEKQATGAQVAR